VIEPVFAHPGHWAVQLVYLAPLLVLVWALVAGKRKERREVRERRLAAPEASRPPRPD